IRLEEYDVGTEDAKLHIFIAHLKAGSDAPNPAKREFEADKYRDWAEANLPDGANVLCLGDFNLRSSNEGAWTVFTETRATNKGQLQDPINQVGTWHNSPGFAGVHTQAPQLPQNLPCSSCGYSGGGMDDRFDFILTSATLHDGINFEYAPNSYSAFGNDGNHYNTSISALPVIPEGQVMADALTCASDHLPVVIELTAPALLSATSSLNFGSVYVGFVAEQTLEVENAAPAPAHFMIYDFTIPADFSGPAGPFLAFADNGPNQHTITMSTAASGTKFGTLVIDSTAVGPSSANVFLAGSVLDHAVPSTQSGNQVLTADLDFGTHAVGGFSDQNAEVHNVDYAINDPFQAALEVYDHNVTGDPRFSVVGFAPADATDTPAVFTVHFDDTGAAPGAYNAVLEFLTRDDTAFPGGVNLDSVSYNLSATIPGAFPKGDLNRNGAVDLPDIPLFVDLLLDPGAATPEDQDLADMNGDTMNDGLDLQPFVDAF
ncbi:MAG: choice-of-anchor D domain-containing protein, partial [Planctomycetota bacterium]|nr:choice-of-anchor D domain-containing protein [Planctomycetota bacterium]